MKVGMRGTQTSLVQEYELICPRCGYDQRGTAMLWTDECPLHGRCAECGLDFDWRRIFLPLPHPWLIEHHPRWGRLRLPIKRAFLTLWKMIRPSIFWREISLHDHVRPAVALTFGALLVLLITAAALAALETERRASAWLRWDSPQYQVVCARVYYLRHYGPRTEWVRLEFDLLWILLTTVCLRLLPDSLQKARVRSVHLVRIASYGAAFALLMGAVAFYVIPTVLYVHEYLVGIHTRRMNGRICMLAPEIGIAAGLVLWHWRAVRDYLRLPHALAVAALMTMLAALITLSIAAAYSIPQGKIDWFVDW